MQAGAWFDRDDRAMTAVNALSVADADDLRASVRAVCDRHATPDHVRAAAYGADGFDRELWGILCTQIGIAGIGIPESAGGAGYGSAALAVVAGEFGRSLAPVPFFSSAVLAQWLLVESGDDELIADVLADLMSGERIAAAVISPDGGAWNPTRVPVACTEGALDGLATHVLGGPWITDLVVVAEGPAGPAIHHVDVAEAVGDGTLEIAHERVLDATRPMITVRFSRTRSRGAEATGPIGGRLDTLVGRALAVLTAEQVGANERVLDMAADYARVREQFGRPIGSFQAIKHRCADMFVDLERSRSASAAAIEAADADGPVADELGWRASMAKAVCSESLRSASQNNIQIHGGIGYTWENDAQLYFKRACSDEVILGGIGHHWDTLAAEAKIV